MTRLALCLLASCSVPALCDSQWSIIWHEPSTCFQQGTLDHCQAVCPGDGTELQCGEVSLTLNPNTSTLTVTRDGCTETLNATVERR